MNKTEKQIRLCMRILHRLVRRWDKEQGTRNKVSLEGIIVPIILEERTLSL